jgi:hypothetical protein
VDSLQNHAHCTTHGSRGAAVFVGATATTGGGGADTRIFGSEVVVELVTDGA